jgi:hypothetical protein
MNLTSNPDPSAPLPTADEGIETIRARLELGLSRRRTHRGVVLFYTLALLLNGGALERTVERLPYGAARRFWLSIVSPVATLSRATNLDAPRQWIEHSIHGKGQAN